MPNGQFFLANENVVKIFVKTQIILINGQNDTQHLGVDDDMTISLIWEDLRSISSLICDDLGSIMFTSKLTNKDEKGITKQRFTSN